jgi:protein TonB
MTAAPAELALNRRPPLREAGLWLGAGIVILAAHASFAYLLRDVAPHDEHDAMEQAMEIDLAPLPVSVPETVPSEALAQEEPVKKIDPVEETAEIEPDEVVEATAVPVEEIQPEPEIEEPVAETAQPELVEPEVVEQETAEVVTPEIVVPLPQPRPEPPIEKRAERKKPASKEPKVVKEDKPAERPKRHAKTPPSTRASAASSAPKIDPSRWNSAVRAAIARRASAVRGMQGTVRVSFVIGSSGAIVSASVTGSSGNARLDRAALRMVRSARVPAPPEGLGGSRHAFAIPLTFR